MMNSDVFVRLTMQVTDFKTEIDDVASLNLVEKVRK